MRAGFSGVGITGTYVGRNWTLVASTWILSVWFVATYWIVVTGDIEPAARWALGIIAPLVAGTCVLAWRQRGKAAARRTLSGIIAGASIGGLGFAWLVWLGNAIIFDESAGSATVEAGVFGSACGAAAGGIGAIVHTVITKIRVHSRT